MISGSGLVTTFGLEFSKIIPTPSPPSPSYLIRLEIVPLNQNIIRGNEKQTFFSHFLETTHSTIVTN
jgi:hypothetical protein